MGRPKFGSHPERDSFLHLTAAAAATPNEFTFQRWREKKRRSPAGITFARTLNRTSLCSRPADRATINFYLFFQFIGSKKINHKNIFSFEDGFFGAAVAAKAWNQKGVSLLAANARLEKPQTNLKFEERSNSPTKPLENVWRKFCKRSFTNIVMINTVC